MAAGLIRELLLCHFFPTTAAAPVHPRGMCHIISQPVSLWSAAVSLSVPTLLAFWAMQHLATPLQSLHLCAIRSDSVTAKCAGFIGTIDAVSQVPQHVDASKGRRAAPPPGLANGSRIDTAISVMRLLYVPASSWEMFCPALPPSKTHPSIIVALFTTVVSGQLHSWRIQFVSWCIHTMIRPFIERWTWSSWPDHGDYTDGCPDGSSRFW